MQRKPLSYGSIWGPLLIGLVLLPVPLLGNFHIESALLAALIGCFWAALKACRPVAGPRSDWLRIAFILRCLYLAGLPLLIYAFVTGCFSWNGLGFWLLYPLPSVFFGYAIGRLLRKCPISFRRLMAVIILLFISVGVLLIEFFHLPQVYFFNQVWGGWPGPIYDEPIKITLSLVFFRGMTVLWILLLWWGPAVRRSFKAKVIVASCLILLAGAYTHLPWMGIITPRDYLQKKLGGKKQTAHFILYYDESHFAPADINYYARREEFYYRQITGALHLKKDRSSKIESYFYAHPWQKKALVGAKFTSYVPVWLRRDQLHIAGQEIPHSLKHELVHVLAKQFGNELFNGSWSIGLMEGVAVALAGNVSPVSTINQIVAAQKPYPTAEEMAQTFSFWGFYSGRSAVNYTQSGSFVRYLLKQYPADDLKKAYRKSDIRAGYPVSMNRLVNGWHRMLDSVSVDSIDRKGSARLYGIPSLLEEKCPHIQSRFAKLWDHSNYFMAEKDTGHALAYLGRARNQAPHEPYVKNKWAYLNLVRGHYRRVQRQASIKDSTMDGLLLDADAFALTGRMRRAKQFVAKAAQRLKKEPDSLHTGALKVREMPAQWKYYREIIYKGIPLDDFTLGQLAEHSRARALQQALNHHNRPRLFRLARIFREKQVDATYFDIYVRLINRLAFLGQTTLTNRWIHNLESLSLRNEYRKRLEEARKWNIYLNR